jgi:outer membrane immunogenic protein
MYRVLLRSAAALAIATASSAALAADMAPEPAPVSSWTAFYLGAGGGLQWADINVNSKFCERYYYPSVSVSEVVEESYDYHYCEEEYYYDVYRWNWEDNDSTVVGVVQGGFDYEVAPSFVIGVFADWTFGDELGSDHKKYIYDDYFAKWSTSIDSMVTVAGRAGFAPTPNLLLYGLVGWSWADIDHDFRIGCDSCSGYFLRNGDTFDANGLTVGGGAEYKVTENISIRGEYRFTDLDNFNDNDNYHEDYYYDAFSSSDVEVDVQQVLFTLNWRFGGFGTTAAAAY